MPCRTEPSDYDNSSDLRTLEKAKNEYKKKADAATRNLCVVLTKVEKDPALFKTLDNGVQQWWREHKEWDRRRAEDRAKKILAKKMEQERMAATERAKDLKELKRLQAKLKLEN